MSLDYYTFIYLFFCMLFQVFKNLKLFMENKQPGDDLFDRLSVSVSATASAFIFQNIVYISYDCNRSNISDHFLKHSLHLNKGTVHCIGLRSHWSHVISIIAPRRCIIFEEVTEKLSESKIELHFFFFSVFLGTKSCSKGKAGTKLQGVRDEIEWGWAIGVERWKG